MKQSGRIPVVLTIAGSDSGGGAGIQADLKVFSTLRVFGTTVITCVTAQNPREVSGIAPLEPVMVAQQLESVCSAFDVRAVKTGMLYSEGIVRCVARDLRKRSPKAVVVDPVMVATSGSRLLERRAFQVLCSELLPAATVITPNVVEAEALTGTRIVSLEGLRSAALQIAARFDTACVVKGGHLRCNSGKARDEVVDVLCMDRELIEYRTRRIPLIGTHGTGCRFSAALTAYLAIGKSIPKAVGRAQSFVAGSLKDPLFAGR
jgi:hydroxymethylpyrimidine/phosphomethylpyrimidine kinase